jgi:hypothetical protein
MRETWFLNDPHATSLYSESCAALGRPPQRAAALFMAGGSAVTVTSLLLGSIKRDRIPLPRSRGQIQKQANAMSIPHDDPRTHLSDIEARLTRFEHWVNAASALGLVFALSSYGMLGTL